jgi:glutaminyl-peptide cyclotransferase
VRRLAGLLAVLAVGGVVFGCGGDTDPSTSADTTVVPARRTVEVVTRYPHDPGAFTQGLVYTDDGRLFESTGLEGRSSLREVRLEDGEVLRLRANAADEFAEGLALVEDRLIQLTWKDEVAHVYALDTFDPVDELGYEGEGWGLCYDGDRLVMSDGSAELTFRDPITFDELGSVTVRASGTEVERLNELECVDGKVYANVWQTEQIVEIDPGSGAVTAQIDASGLLTPAERAGTDVLNGIAYDGADDTFLVTGKLWPVLFEVRIVDAPS